MDTQKQPSTLEKNKRPISPNKAAQIKAIKNRLSVAQGNHPTVSTNQLLATLNDEYGFELNYSALKNTLNPSNEILDMYVVLALCRYWHLDTAYILSDPQSVGAPMPNANELLGVTPNEDDRDKDSRKFIILDDKHYFGDFHGYLYSSTPTSSEIIHFDLHIKEHASSVKANFVYHGFPVRVDGTVDEFTRELHGTPILHVNRSNIFIPLTNDLGDFYFLFYNRQRFRYHDLYFRRGIALSSSALQDKPPMVQSFVLFAHKLSPEKEVYLPGLLASADPNFFIPTGEVERMIASDPDIEQFFNDFGHILNHDIMQVYNINERQIMLAVRNNTMDKISAQKCLYRLKDKSIYPNRVVYNDDEDISSFAKNFLQKP